jgi:Holliday junction resolvase RusA-like endonuclease
MTKPSVSFVVWGNAEPKGSARAFVPKGWTRAVVTSANPNLKRWEQTIRGELQRIMPETSPETLQALFSGPVRVTLFFYLARPKSLPKRWTEPTKKPDLDKLTRGAIDALSGVLFRDDAQVIALEARKYYAAQAPYLMVTVSLWASALDECVA